MMWFHWIKWSSSMMFCSSKSVDKRCFLWFVNQCKATRIIYHSINNNSIVFFLIRNKSMDFPLEIGNSIQSSRGQIETNLKWKKKLSTGITHTHTLIHIVHNKSDNSFLPNIPIHMLRTVTSYIQSMFF